MKYKLILSLLLFPFFLHAQLIKERDVIASGGGSLSSGNLKVDFTIAEMTVTTLNAGGIELTQGFIQPSGLFIGIDEDPAGNHISVYPNPFSSQLRVSVDAPAGDDWECYITDMLGRRVSGSYFNISGSAPGNFTIDCSEFQQGAYMIHFKRADPEQSVTYKLIKTK